MAACCSSRPAGWFPRHTTTPGPKAFRCAASRNRRNRTIRSKREKITSLLPLRFPFQNGIPPYAILKEIPYLCLSARDFRQTTLIRTKLQFKDIIGQRPTIERLVRGVDTGRVSHAQLFSGQEGYGPLPLAIAYARATYIARTVGKATRAASARSCRQIAQLAHPDLHFVFPVNTPKGRSGEKPLERPFPAAMEENRDRYGRLFRRAVVVLGHRDRQQAGQYQYAGSRRASSANCRSNRSSRNTRSSSSGWPSE